MEKEENTTEVFHIAGFTFFADFDSGNLAHVRHDTDELEDGDDHQEDQQQHNLQQPRPSTSTTQIRAAGGETPAYRFSIWTRPDCQGTEFENGNRTWFYFGMKSGAPGSVVRFTVQNLNKQNKLFSQGMVPVYQVGGRPGWERIRDQPEFSVREGNFYMSFRFRCLEESDSVVYFAFTYPYTYRELQQSLVKLERKHENGKHNYTELTQLPDTSIYFHRELVVLSLEGRRLDLITISGMNSLLPDREISPLGLFPEIRTNPRAHKFAGKKVVFLSARVHPGETCSSYVMLGLFKFLLNEKDPRAIALRRKYVFQLVPMLNPDGVFRGHYRTDTRGVNLNRVYSAPSLSLHPTIFAARKLVLLAHLGEDVNEDVVTEPVIEPKKVPPNLPEMPIVSDDGLITSHPNDTFCDWYKPQSVWQQGSGRGFVRGRTSTSSRVSNCSRTSSTISSHLPAISPIKAAHKDLNLNWYEMTDTSRCSEGDESVADFSLPSFGPSSFRQSHLEETTFLPPDPNFASSSSSRRNSEARTTFSGAFKQKAPSSPVKDIRERQMEENVVVATVEEEVPQPSIPSFDDEIPLYKPRDGDTNLFLYVDIHGHASKRGIFMYGNHFEDPDEMVSALLFPKLMSINSANFDFPACNFTQRNMFMKDRHTGAGREGSGRVSVYKATGLTYCYTLECNFNTGRHTNTVPLASRDCGRASPPPVYDCPPRYCPAIYEDCGKYLAVSILDLTESNPWTRLPCSPCTTLKGVKQWIKQYIKSAEAESAAKAAKSSKASPMRTRLRSLSSGNKKSPLKQIKLPLAQESTTNLPVSKVARKTIVSPKSAGPKLNRQNSRSKSAKSATDSSIKKKRSTSAKKLSSGSTTRPASKVGGSRGGSRSGSRASSPRCGKLEPKVTKLGLQKKTLSLQKSVWNSVDDTFEGAMTETSLNSVKKVKRKKKRIVPTTST